jgi:hypothetical protein
MSEIKRGYPNPNYTDGDILTEEEAELLADVGLVTIDADHYEELVSKAAALDILTADIKSLIDSGESGYGLINDSLVLAVTGMGAYQRKKKMEEKTDGQD